ncbi:DNA helicase UvrD [archaeon]|jgi:uncharacterized protein (TIGR00375 family)|nr:DNA helicase UvrD [archaeon]
MEPHSKPTPPINISNTIIADLHIHSKFSRACSKELNIPNLVKWARIKGVNLLGTGDFTHHEWLKELKQHLKEENGIHYYQDEQGKFPFILTHEISLIYTQEDKGRRVHLLYLAPNFETVDKINQYLDTKGRRDYDGRPIFKISCRDFSAKMQEINPDIEIIPAHIWTPYFGVFGSKGGFNTLQEAFQDQTKNIHAIETGISSDPNMNLKIKELRENNISIVSFSDLHSFWPWRLGREATIFHKPEENQPLTYKTIINQIRNNTFIGTIETDPAYGKYHFDGHEKCNFSSSSEQTKTLNNICPKCNKPLIIGVDSRVKELSQEDENFQDDKKFYTLLPLHEIISLAVGKGMNTKTCWTIYDKLIENFQTEFNILLKTPKEQLLQTTNNQHLTDLIIKNRNGQIKVKPGYDGVYGEAVLDEKEEPIQEIPKEQKTLF